MEMKSLKSSAPDFESYPLMISNFRNLFLSGFTDNFKADL